MNTYERKVWPEEYHTENRISFNEAFSVKTINLMTFLNHYLSSVTQNGCLRNIQIWPLRCAWSTIHWTIILVLCLSLWLSFYDVCGISKDSDETVHLRRLAWSIRCRPYIKHHFCLLEDHTISMYINNITNEI